MSLNPIGYVVQLPIPDGVTLYLACFTRGGVELTADLDRAMLFDTEGRAKDFAFHASFILSLDGRTFEVEKCFEQVTLNGDADLLDDDSDSPDDISIHISCKRK